MRIRESREACDDCPVCPAERTPSGVPAAAARPSRPFMYSRRVMDVRLYQLDPGASPPRTPRAFARGAPRPRSAPAGAPVARQSSTRLTRLTDDVDERRLAAFDDGDGARDRRAEIFWIGDRTLGIHAEPLRHLGV